MAFSTKKYIDGIEPTLDLGVQTLTLAKAEFAINKTGSTSIRIYFNKKGFAGVAGDNFTPKADGSTDWVLSQWLQRMNIKLPVYETENEYDMLQFIADTINNKKGLQVRVRVTQDDETGLINATPLGLPITSSETDENLTDEISEQLNNSDFDPDPEEDLPF